VPKGTSITRKICIVYKDIITLHEFGVSDFFVGECFVQRKTKLHQKE
jgi:hypothetical protein